MDRVGPRMARRCENALGVEIALARRRASDRDGFVGVTHVERPPIGLRKHRDGLEPELTAGAEHPASDFSPIGDEDRADQRRSARMGVARDDIEGGHAPASLGRGPADQHHR